MATVDCGQGEVSLLLQELRVGLPDAEARLLNIVYSELRRIAGYHLQRDRSGHTLQPTALVNEAYLRLTRAKLASAYPLVSTVPELLYQSSWGTARCGGRKRFAEATG
jgi:hypothetical protein